LVSSREQVISGGEKRGGKEGRAWGKRLGKLILNTAILSKLGWYRGGKSEDACREKRGGGGLVPM